MEVKRAAAAGFCFGVKRAIELALQARAENTGRIFTLGPLIHNPQVVRLLAEKGIEVIQDLAAAAAGTLVIRSHGVEPEVLAAAQELGLKVVDATCPFVKRAQELARDLTAQGYMVVVVGDREHPEVRGIVGWTGGRAQVVEGPDEAARLPLLPRVGVIAQTTQPLDNFEAVVAVLRRRLVEEGEMPSELRVFSTICHATAERQQAARELAAQVDVMVVVGGYDSANTRKLAAICRESGTPTYHIETADQLKPEWFVGAQVAGLTAGASTPDWIIEEVERRMKELAENAQEEMQMADFRTLRGGEIVKGVVVAIDQNEVLVDVGGKTEGIIPLRELSCCEISSPHEVVSVGDEIDVWVVKAEDHEGRIVLSKGRADAEKAWVKLQEAFAKGTPVEGVVREVVKGGVIVDLGVRAFLPASLVDRGYVEDLTKYLGQKVTCKVIELNRARKKVVLSRKAILEEEYQRKREELFNSLQEGAVVRGVVRRLTSFGAFVDIGGLDGLLHISEIAWHRVNHPAEVLKIGQEIEVKVIKIDRENGKISLSRKQVIPDPWDTVAEKYPVGSLVEAKVVRLAPFGAFVELEPGVEGLVHISHFADWHVEKPEDVLNEGDRVTLRVLSVDPTGRRIRLSLRDAIRKGEDVAGDEQRTIEDSMTVDYASAVATAETEEDAGETAAIGLPDDEISD
ncbi:bifunctional 4-hydroxy-3-methylbut-2-enyl diphosphate reductase/30S ribosomal protein S1 [Thermodesulfitimonas autotrophica]|uniref:bifunctional 4-hydroxy-3-methylbut-2-enyl diphosphate reductase/30S ribosomal protein S1 n=1 Tax=Thermodesulfitimonas autotrophica TaxID=1894989 RepID=UPI002FE1CA2C